MGERTPLHQACLKCHYTSVELLLDHGANVNVKDKVNATPLHIALREGVMGSKIAKLLIEKGAKVNVIGGIMERTPLHQACTNGNEATIQLLLDHGANVNVEDNENITPLHVALRERVIGSDRNCSRIAKLLIEKGANVNAVGGVLERTPLHEACLTGKKTAVQLLLGHGGNVYVQDKENKTPLQLVPKHLPNSSDIRQILECQKDGPPPAKKSCQDPATVGK